MRAFQVRGGEKKKCSDHIQRHFRQQGTFKGKTAAATIRSLRVCVRKTLTDPRLALTLSNAFCSTAAMFQTITEAIYRKRNRLSVLRLRNTIAKMTACPLSDVI